MLLVYCTAPGVSNGLGRTHLPQKSFQKYFWHVQNSGMSFVANIIFHYRSLLQIAFLNPVRQVNDDDDVCAITMY